MYRIIRRKPSNEATERTIRDSLFIANLNSEEKGKFKEIIREKRLNIIKRSVEKIIIDAEDVNIFELSGSEELKSIQKLLNELDEHIDEVEIVNNSDFNNRAITDIINSQLFRDSIKANVIKEEDYEDYLEYINSNAMQNAKGIFLHTLESAPMLQQESIYKVAIRDYEKAHGLLDEEKEEIKRVIL